MAARVHFPTFGERPERQKKPKVIVKEVGRGSVFETTIANVQDADTALLAKIRVLEVKRRVLGDTGPHLVKMPTAQRVFEYRHGFACVLDLPWNRREPILNLVPAATLFQRLLESSEGSGGGGRSFLLWLINVKAQELADSRRFRSRCGVALDPWRDRQERGRSPDRRRQDPAPVRRTGLRMALR